MYSETGRPSVPPEQLLKATVLMAMYSIRSVRAFCERLNHDMLFKWFLDLNVDAPAMDASTFSKNQERLLKQEIAMKFLAAVVAQAKLRRYVSNEHFSADGTLLEAWASHKSFKPKDDNGNGASGPGRNAEVNFHGERRTNETHESTTDPEARMARKSNATGAKLSFAGHLLMENRSALIVDMELTQATGHAERDTALAMLERLPGTKRRRTVAADKAYDTRDFVNKCREIGVTPHVAQNTTKRSSRIDGRTTRHRGHEVSQRIRKRIEEPFGWIKVIAGGRKYQLPFTDKFFDCLPGHIAHLSPVAFCTRHDSFVYIRSQPHIDSGRWPVTRTERWATGPWTWRELIKVISLLSLFRQLVDCRFIENAA